VQTSRERNELASKKRILSSEYSSVKSKYLRCSHEKKQLQQSFEAQLKTLEIELDRFRLSNDRLFDSFRSHVSSSQHRALHRTARRSTADSRPYSEDNSSVVICARCVDGRCSSKHQDESRQLRASLGRSSVSSHLLRSSSQRNSVGFGGSQQQNGSLADEIKRSLLQTKQERSTFGELLNTKASLPKLSINHHTLLARSSLKSEADTGRDSQQGLTCLNRVTEDVCLFDDCSRPDNRHSLATCFSALLRKSPLAVPPHHSHIESKAKEVSRPKFDPAKNPTPNRIVFRPLENWMHTSTTEQQSPDLKSASSDNPNLLPSLEASIDTNPREEQACLPHHSRPALPAAFEPEPLQPRKRWTHEREQSRTSCSKERAYAASSRLLTVRESVQDCESFSELLREKLASIESKLKCKTLIS